MDYAGLCHTMQDYPGLCQPMQDYAGQATVLYSLSRSSTATVLCAIAKSKLTHSIVYIGLQCYI